MLSKSKICIKQEQIGLHCSSVSSRYGYSWKVAEAEKNLLRTHTTAVSSRMLYKLAQEGFRPAKYFSVDRVFRNEAIDRTHLAEFHQIEGMFKCLTCEGCNADNEDLHQRPHCCTVSADSRVFCVLFMHSEIEMLCAMHLQSSRMHTDALKWLCRHCHRWHCCILCCLC